MSPSEAREAIAQGLPLLIDLGRLTAKRACRASSLYSTIDELAQDALDDLQTPGREVAGVFHMRLAAAYAYHVIAAHADDRVTIEVACVARDTLFEFGRDLLKG